MAYGWFVAPNSMDEGPGYVRNSQNVVLKGTVLFQLGGIATGPVRILTKRTEAEGEIVIKKWDAVSSTFDTASLADGHYIATATNCHPMDFIIRNGATPVRGPFIGFVAANVPNEDISMGHEWLPYADPPPLPKGNKLAPRTDMAPFGLVGRDDIFVRPLTRYTGPNNAVKQWGEDENGNVQVCYFQVYRRGSATILIHGNRRDGPYGLGGLGVPVSVRPMNDGAYLFTALNGAVMELLPDGTVRTIWGYRIPAGKPVPALSQDTFDADSPSLGDLLLKRYEMVGTGTPLDPWMALQSKKNPDWIWICNTDGHQVLKVSRSTSQTLGILGSPTGEMGHTTGGIGEAVRLRRPRGLAISPLTGELYLTQAWNHSIGIINEDTLEFTEVHRSAVNWDNFMAGGTIPVGNTKGSNFYNIPTTQIREWFNADGGDGIGSYHHPQQCAFRSDGRLLFPADHTRTIHIYDPVTRSVKVHKDLWEGAYQHDQQYKHSAWISFDVNTFGEGPMQDAMVFADWDGGSQCVLTPAGELLFPLFRDARPLGSGDWHGRLNRVYTMAYPWCCGFVPGAIVAADSSSEAVVELSMRKTTDPDPPIDLYMNGAGEWSIPGPDGLSLWARFDLGNNQLGQPQFQDMAAWSDEQMKTWILGYRADLAGNDGAIKNVIGFIRYHIMEAGMPPVDNPVTIHSFTATPSLVEAGDSAVLDAVIENATRITVDGKLMPVPWEPLRVTPIETHEYLLVATNADSSASARTTITVHSVVPPDDCDEVRRQLAVANAKLAQCANLAERIVAISKGEL